MSSLEAVFCVFQQLRLAALAHITACLCEVPTRALSFYPWAALAYDPIFFFFF